MILEVSNLVILWFYGSFLPFLIMHIQGSYSSNKIFFFSLYAQCCLFSPNLYSIFAHTARYAFSFPFETSHQAVNIASSKRWEDRYPKLILLAIFAASHWTKVFKAMLSSTSTQIASCKFTFHWCLVSDLFMVLLLNFIGLFTFSFKPRFPNTIYCRFFLVKGHFGPAQEVPNPYHFSNLMIFPRCWGH